MGNSALMAQHWDGDRPEGRREKARDLSYNVKRVEGGQSVGMA